MSTFKSNYVWGQPKSTSSGTSSSTFGRSTGRALGAIEEIPLPDQFSETLISDAAVFGGIYGVVSWSGYLAIFQLTTGSDGYERDIKYQYPSTTGTGFTRTQTQSHTPIMRICFQNNNDIDCYIGDAAGSVKKVLASVRKDPEEVFSCGGPIIGLKADQIKVYALSLDGYLQIYDTTNPENYKRLSVTGGKLPVGFDVCNEKVAIITSNKLLFYDQLTDKTDDIQEIKPIAVKANSKPPEAGKDDKKQEEQPQQESIVNERFYAVAMNKYNNSNSDYEIFYSKNNTLWSIIHSSDNSNSQPKQIHKTQNLITSIAYSRNHNSILYGKDVTYITQNRSNYSHKNSKEWEAAADIITKVIPIQTEARDKAKFLVITGYDWSRGMNEQEFEPSALYMYVPEK